MSSAFSPKGLSKASKENFFPKFYSLRLNFQSGEKLYLQIAQQLMSLIEHGDLKEGERLPSTRDLASFLSVHRNTVIEAYKNLQDSGYILSQIGRGSFVAPMLIQGKAEPLENATSLPWADLLNPKLQNEAFQRLERLRSPLAAENPVDFSRMEPSEELIPHEALTACIEAVSRRIGAKAWSYAEGQGLKGLREAIALHLKGQALLDVGPDDLVITTGSQQALDIIARSLLKKGDLFLTDGWTSSGLLNALMANGGRVESIDSDKEGPKMESLESFSEAQVKGLYLMPNSRNPTGERISLKRRLALVAWSEKAGIPLIEDDYGAELVTGQNQQIPHLRALSKEVFYVGTFSKILSPALRVGYMLAPRALREPLISLKKTTDLGSSLFLQHVLLEFLQRGLLEPHVKQVGRIYQRRLKLLTSTLAEELPKEVSFQSPDAGLVLWLRLPKGLEPERVFLEARQEGVLVSPGSIFSGQAGATAEGQGSSGLRLAFSAETEERIVLGAKRLSKVLRRLIHDPSSTVP